MDWSKQCDKLLKASGGLFQWASTACNAICDNTAGALLPAERLTRFLSAQGLDALYSEVLSQAFNIKDETDISRFRVVMGRVLAVKEPLSVMAHSELHSQGEPANVTELVVRQLGSLLSGVNQADVPVMALHSSFFDFLKDKARSGHFYVDPSPHNQSLTLSTFQVMKAGLQFNICKLETSYLQNDDVPDLAERVKKYLSEHLSYACRFWADHLITTQYNLAILKHLQYFLEDQLLYWLEVLSVIKQVNIASAMLSRVSNWIQVCK